MRNSDKPAFPSDYNYGEKGEFGEPIIVHKVSFGLTKREYFALHLMSALITNADRHSQDGDCQSWNYEHLSEISINAADQLLNQLEN